MGAASVSTPLVTTVRYASPKPKGTASRQVSGPFMVIPSVQEIPNLVPLAEGVESLDPHTVHEAMANGSAVLVDVRGDDRAAGLIESAVHVPVKDDVPFHQKVHDLVKEWADQKLVVFTCQYSAHRGPWCANLYRDNASSSQRVAVLQGGFRGWESAGLHVMAAAQSSRVSSDADSLALQQS